MDAIVEVKMKNVQLYQRFQVYLPLAKNHGEGDWGASSLNILFPDRVKD